jgi:outer membrane biosynthesis protein TonB
MLNVEAAPALVVLVTEPATEEETSPAQETTAAETTPTPTEQQQAAEQTPVQIESETPTASETPTETTRSLSAQQDVSATATEAQLSTEETTAAAETSVGVASASAFFSLADVSLWQVISGLVFLAILVTVLLVIGFRSEPQLSRRDLLYKDMNTYLWQRWIRKEAPGSKFVRK